MALYRVPIGLTWNGKGSPGVNVFTIRTVSDLPDDLAPAMAALSTFYTALAPHLASGTVVKAPEFVTTVVSDEERAGGATPEFVQVAAPWTVNATGSGAAPAPVAITCTWYTSVATRRGRGRTFVSPLSDNVVFQDGTPNDAALVNIRNGAQALVDDSTGNVNGWALAIWSEMDNLARDVIRTQVRDSFAVLRSRRD